MSDQNQIHSKKLLRNFFINRRNEYFDNYKKKINAHTHINLILENTDPCLIGSYLPFRNEFPTNKIHDELIKSKFEIALPCINNQDSSMIFRKFTSNDDLISNNYGILEPSKSSKEVSPLILLVPLLAFSLTGFRLGYGGGYYDRYIEKNLSNKNFLTIGLGFSFQKYSEIPRENHDQKLNWILTEKYLYNVE